MVLDGDAAEKITYYTEYSRADERTNLHIRDAFVFKWWVWINGYLSLNIRHGTLEDELKSPLNKSYLSNTKKDTYRKIRSTSALGKLRISARLKCMIEKANTDFHIKNRSYNFKVKRHLYSNKNRKKKKSQMEYLIIGWMIGTIWI